MEILTIEATNETPAVHLNASEGQFNFTGKSYPENVNEFYGSTLNYIQDYIKNPAEKTTLEFAWSYYNTATSKIMIKIIKELKTVVDAGKEFQINWHCKSSDELMIEKGEELKDLLDVNFSVIQF
ncbi:MAG: DUF1987 domain-containing protein [Sphingobacteriaceae bacterium]|nr:DUF1987 domain-containing protein [Sphingobacteriaceae bacterium]